MVELKGSLSGIGLPAIVQLLGELHQTGRLELTSGRWVAHLAFLDGRLVDATLGQERGLSAVAASMLTLSEGEFAFVQGSPPDERTIDLGPDGLHAHLGDLSTQRARAGSAIPSLDAVPSLADGERADDPEREHVLLERSALQMLLLVDGQRTVRDIVGSRPLVPALRDLAMLADQGLITIHTPAPLPIPIGAPPLPPHEAVDAPATLGGATAIGVCLKLGFADDPARHYSRATALHRCYAGGAAALVTAQEQRELCLSGRYPLCPRFHDAGSPAPETETAATTVPALRWLGTPARTAAEVTLPTQGRESAPPVATTPSDLRQRLTRGPVLLALGAVLGVVLLGLIALLLVRSATPAGEPLAAPPGPSTQTGPAPTPILVNTPAVAIAGASSVPTNAARANATFAAPVARTLPTPTSRGAIDVRFAAGPQPEWLDNPPVARWSDGAYRLQARQAARFVAVSAPVIDVPTNVLVAATFRKTGGPPGGGYGLLVRDQSTAPRDGVNQTLRAYVFETGDLGEVGIWRREGDRWIDLQPWTRLASVHPGGSPNDLLVRAVRSQLSFSVNGDEVATIDDDTLSDGGVGIFVGGDFNEVALDRFTVRAAD